MAKPLDSLSEITFGSFLAYSPRGTSEKSRHSRTVTYAIKQDRHGMIADVADVLKVKIDSAGLAELLNPDVLLVPAPRRAPLVRGALWPTRRICEEFVKRGLGREVVPCLERTEAVAKSAWAQPGERPGVRDHIATMRVEPSLMGNNITIVDDVVTRGATLLAAVTHLSAAFRDSKVRAFALIRTMGLQPEIDEIVDPCVGRISSIGYNVRRQP